MVDQDTTQKRITNVQTYQTSRGFKRQTKQKRKLSGLDEINTQEQTFIRQETANSNRRPSIQQRRTQRREQKLSRRLPLPSGDQLVKKILSPRETHAMTQKITHKSEALLVGLPLSYTVAWFYIPQLGLVLLFYAMNNLNQTTVIANYFVNTQEIAYLAWMLTIGLGMGLMLYAVSRFLFAGILVFRRTRIFSAFLFCTAFYFAPYLFIVPWVNIWILLTIWWLE